MAIKIGIDINGVLADNKRAHIKTHDYSVFSVMKDAIDIVREIVNQHGAENVYIISRVKSHQLSFITGIWMETHNFLKETNVLLDNVYICNMLKDKARIAKELRLTHFVDDRPAVLNHFPESIVIIAFQPGDKEMKKYPDVLSRAKVANSWKEVGKYLNVA
ncbi:MAG: hypothetical protein Q8L10_04750 [Candidatus Moranbacteria bacterium]|nr:hypothetical protein [Candidatus Moranbacteria bacterium]